MITHDAPVLFCYPKLTPFPVLLKLLPALLYTICIKKNSIRKDQCIALINYNVKIKRQLATFTFYSSGNLNDWFIQGSSLMNLPMSGCSNGPYYNQADSRPKTTFCYARCNFRAIKHIRIPAESGVCPGCFVAGVHGYYVLFFAIC